MKQKEHEFVRATLYADDRSGVLKN